MADIATNRRAFHFYEILSKVEAGMILVGTEVKSLRSGRATIEHGYAHARNGKLTLLGVDIPAYGFAGPHRNHEPGRTRTLLVHKRQMRELEAHALAKGNTLIPLRIYFHNGFAKVELGLARGRRAPDRRAAIRKRETERDIRRAMERRR